MWTASWEWQNFAVLGSGAKHFPLASAAVLVSQSAKGLVNQSAKVMVAGTTNAVQTGIV